MLPVSPATPVVPTVAENVGFSAPCALVLLSAVTVIVFFVILIVEVTTSESLWLLSPTTFTYIVFAPFVKSVYDGAIVE